MAPKKSKSANHGLKLSVSERDFPPQPSHISTSIEILHEVENTNKQLNASQKQGQSEKHCQSQLRPCHKLVFIATTSTILPRPQEPRAFPIQALNQTCLHYEHRQDALAIQSPDICRPISHEYCHPWSASLAHMGHGALLLQDLFLVDGQSE